MAVHEDANDNSSFLVDSLFCEEEKWEDEEEEEEKEEADEVNDLFGNVGKTHFFPCVFLEENEELLSMLSKEKQQQNQTQLKLETLASDPILLAARSVSVEWILKVKSHYGFSTLTAVLAVAYLDKFLSSSHFQSEKPWMNQLVAVTCLSLAAKVEEIHVPLLLDLQVEDAKYVFEAKTIQRMELLILSTLQWKMHPVTTYSFLDHIAARLGFKTNLHMEFFRRCENLLLSLLSDSRFVGYLPSVIAAAAMMEVIKLIEPQRSSEHQDQLLGVLKMSKEKVRSCYSLVIEHSKASSSNGCYYHNHHKRKLEADPGSPSGVIDAGFISDSSNDSWEPRTPKRSKTEEPKMKFPSLKRVFLEIVGSPS